MTKARLINKECQGTAQAAVLLIPGLNNRLSVLEALAEQYRKNGICTSLLELSQAEGEEQWFEELQEAYQEFSSQFSDLPKIGFGYSLGALLLVALFENTSEELNFERILLVAPPFRLAGLGAYLRFITPLRHLCFSLPSAAPREFRQSNSTRLQSYFTMLQLGERLSRLEQGEKLRAKRFSILAHQNDAFVSYKGIEEWLERNRFQKSILEPFPDKEVKLSASNHLLVHPSFLSKKQWSFLKEKCQLD